MARDTRRSGRSAGDVALPAQPRHGQFPSHRR
jgi:hypothetical protein